MTNTSADDVRQQCAEPGCTQTRGLAPDANGQLRCAHHDPARRAQRDSKLAKTMKRKRLVEQATRGIFVEPDELPVASISTLADALKMAQWVPVAVALGKIGNREAAVIISGLKEFRMTYADSVMADRIADLERRIAAAKARGVEV